MTKTLKVAVIGVGGIAGTHFPGWKASPHAELYAFGDIVPETLHRLGDQHGIDPALRYEDSWELFKNPDIDIVDICTPNMYHTPLTVAALEHGKHVICEKPLAPTPQNIKEMIAARDKSGKTLMTAQHFRFTPEAKALKAEVETGVLGDIYHARSWMLRRQLCPTRDSFLQKQHSGGGPCIDIGVHILDLTLWMMGNPKPVTVSGVTQDKLMRMPGAWSVWGGAIPSERADVEEFAAAMVRFESGATLVLEVSWLLHHKTTGEDMQMWLYGDKGGAHWPDNEILTGNNATQQQLNMSLQIKPSGLEAHAEECKVFAQAISEGRPSPVPAEQSLDVMAILDGLYRSADSKREVAL
jgi:predicted dehydrogenase